MPKRRPHDEAVDYREPEAEEKAQIRETVQPRKASALTKETRERMQNDPRWATMTEDETEEVRLAFEATLLNDVPRVSEVLDEEAVRTLAVDQSVNVMARRADRVGQAPTDLKTGMLALFPERLPDAFQVGKVLPIGREQRLHFIRDKHNSLQDILTFFPLSPIAVFTPKLLLLLTLGEAATPTQDSFLLFQAYIACMSLLMNHPDIRSRKKAVFDFIEQSARDKTLTRLDVETFAASLTFAYEIDDPLRAENMRMAIVQAYDDNLLDSDASVLSEVMETTSFIAPGQAQPYGTARVGMYVEDVFAQHSQQGIQVCQDICDEMNPDSEVDAREFTTQMLNVYERTICNMLMHCFKKPVFFREYIGDLCSTPVFPETEQIHEEVEISLQQSKAHFTNARRAILQSVDPSFDNQTSDDEVLTRFIEFNFQEETDLANAMANMTVTAHEFEAKELIKGVSVDEEAQPFDEIIE
jgi:hypothetical protein